MHARFRVRLPTIGRCGLLRTLIDLRQNPLKVTPGFVAFSTAWRATFLPLPPALARFGFNDLRKPFSLALRPVFDAQGVAWEPMGRLGDR